MASDVHYPVPGCVVEFLEANAIQIAVVLEENSGKLRLLLPSRRELKLSANRVLPWFGPLLSLSQSREDLIRQLEELRDRRKKLSEEIDPLAVWEIAQGEMEQAEAAFFAELFEDSPAIDSIAAFGHALLSCKTHFRFKPPVFQIYDAESMEKRLTEKKAKEEKEALIEGGSAFLRLLWDLSLKRKTLQKSEDAENSLAPEIRERIERLLRSRMIDPESVEDETLWRMLSHGLPDDPFLPVLLLIAWGKIPEHYNFWLDRADYESGDEWWQSFAKDVQQLAETESYLDGLQPVSLEFLSIDSEKTKDIDDAFHIVQNEDGGWLLTVALACVALPWSFDSGFDKQVQARATSLYLPEAVMHMLPEKLGTDAYSLVAGVEKPLFCIKMNISAKGEISDCEPFLAKGKVKANLNYADVEKVLQDDMQNIASESANPAAQYAGILKMAYDMACAREKKRIEDGAIIMRKLEPQIKLNNAENEVVVDIYLPENTDEAQKVVSEMMIAASASIADWASERDIPLIHRTQDVEVAREYSGVWSDPWELAKIMRSLVPSQLERVAAPHAALALKRYAPVTSPLRRYADLVNEAQIIHWLRAGSVRWNGEELDALLGQLLPNLSAAGQVQRFRPRYWKLLYFLQQGDKTWWDGVITEENELHVTVAIPEKGLIVRGRRNFFEDPVYPGAKVRMRLGRINPLRNDIHILEAMPE